MNKKINILMLAIMSILLYACIESKTIKQDHEFITIHVLPDKFEGPIIAINVKEGSATLHKKDTVFIFYDNNGIAYYNDSINLVFKWKAKNGIPLIVLRDNYYCYKGGKQLYPLIMYESFGCCNRNHPDSLDYSNLSSFLVFQTLDSTYVKRNKKKLLRERERMIDSICPVVNSFRAQSKLIN